MVLDKSMPCALRACNQQKLHFTENISLNISSFLTTKSWKSYQILARR